MANKRCMCNKVKRCQNLKLYTTNIKLALCNNNLGSLAHLSDQLWYYYIKPMRQDSSSAVILSPTGGQNTRLAS